MSDNDMPVSKNGSKKEERISAEQGAAVGDTGAAEPVRELTAEAKAKLAELFQ